jgi:arylsulfatase
MKWSADRMFLMVPAQVFVREYLETLKEFPPAQGSSLSINQVLESMQKQSARQ